MTEVAQNEEQIEDRLVEAMKNVEKASQDAAPTLSALRDKMQAAEAFIPKVKQSIENFVENKLAAGKQETEELTRLLEAKQTELSAKIEAMRHLQSDIVKMMAEVGHLRTHKIILDMANFSHGQALGEIVAQGAPEQKR